MFENCYKLSREILITETFKVNVQRDSFLLFFLYPWRIVRVNLTGLRLRSKQDFILLFALFYDVVNLEKYCESQQKIRGSVVI